MTIAFNPASAPGRETAALAAVIAANPGRRIEVTGPITLTDTISIRGDGTRLFFDGAVTCTFSQKPMIQVLNAWDCSVDGTWFDPGWAAGVAVLRLAGSLLGNYVVRGDRMYAGIVLDSSGADATQQNTNNELTLHARNAIRGLVFRGSAGRESSNNVLRHVAWWSAGSVAASIGIDYQQYADNNTVDWAFLSLNRAGHIGVIDNSSQPTTDVEVYENHARSMIIEGNVNGTVGMKGNRTWQTVGRWPTYRQVRLSGRYTPRLDIAANSDIRLTPESNINGAVP